MAPDSDITASNRALDAEASALMKRGIGLLDTWTADAAAEALVCFDQALALRQQLPVDRVDEFTYGLAACWLNRADALTRLGGDDRHGAAVTAFDEAILVLQRLTLDHDDRYRRRLAIACQNRGLLLFAHFPARSNEAMHNLTEALSLLEDERASQIEDRAHLLGAVYVNLANAHRADRRPEAPAHARTAAERAMALASEHERTDPINAEIGLKARHILCQVLAQQLSDSMSSGIVQADDVHAATDAVDDGLDLVRTWEGRGVTHFRDLASDLFRFGALVYQRFQPQFLDEFLTEYGVPVEVRAADDTPEAPDETRLTPRESTE